MSPLMKDSTELVQKKKIVIQTPRLEILSDKDYQQKFSEDMEKYQKYNQDGQKISEQSLLTRFNK